MKFELLVLVAVAFKLALSLTCLQCDNVPQPRHCKTVGECFDGEVCGVEKFTNSFGEELFNVGCVQQSKCGSSSSIDDCIECCQTDLCNAKGCGENGYPLSRGPICYSCQVHTDSKPCHTIQFCGMGEVCMSEAHTEFGDIVYTSKCTNTHVCKSDIAVPSIVGRDLDDVEGFAKRTGFGHVCQHCCQEDTCNRRCNNSNTGEPTSLCQQLNPCQNGKCYDIPGDYVCVCNNGFDGKLCNISTSLCQRLSPCQHGKCYDIPGDYDCVCDNGYGGKQCNISTSLCHQLSPCQHGKCYDIPGDYLCTCDDGYGGKQCNISKNHCLSSPCQNGTCYDIPGDYVCVCDHGYEGKRCNISFCGTNKCVHGHCTFAGHKGNVCLCKKGYIGFDCDKSTLAASDCYDILKMNISKTSGVYSVTLWKSKRVIEVFCDMDTANGGWTVFQRRFNGSVDFYRNFSEYENGFGRLNGEFWLGLSTIQEMTATRRTELRIDLTAADGSQAYELFQHFSLGNAPKYTLHIDKGTGTAGNMVVTSNHEVGLVFMHENTRVQHHTSVVVSCCIARAISAVTGDDFGLSYSNNHDFATYARDNNYNCTFRDHGEWWYYNCLNANLNGEYGTPGRQTSYQTGEGGFIYYDFQRYNMLKKSVMMFRRV